jgi:(1->4)-alpha-D-glucan 1-alpha-D-glucosylmutase
VPDVYQGTELWDLSLVDPDNRRPVDWELRRRLVGELDGLEVEDVLARADEGLPKLWLTVQALRLRQRRPAAFDRHGGYLPLRATGTAADHVVAYSRGEPACVVPVAPRLLLGLERDGGWGDTTLELPPGSWRDVLTGDERPGGQIRLHDLLARFPVALLERTDPS